MQIPKAASKWRFIYPTTLGPIIFDAQKRIFRQYTDYTHANCPPSASPEATPCFAAWY
jgi:hypothetical protein